MDRGALRNGGVIQKWGPKGWRPVLKLEDNSKHNSETGKYSGFSETEGELQHKIG